MVGSAVIVLFGVFPPPITSYRFCGYRSVFTLGFEQIGCAISFARLGVLWFITAVATATTIVLLAHNTTKR